MPKSTSTGSDRELFGVLAPMAGLVYAPFRAQLLQAQLEQNAKVRSVLNDVPNLNSLCFVVRAPDGSGGDSLPSVFENLEQGTAKLVLLYPGIVNPQDIVQVSTVMEEWGMKVSRSVLGGGFSSERDSISGYVANSVKELSQRLFPDRKVDCVIVRNATKQDLLDTVALGGADTALVVGGHGSIGCVVLTDGIVKNTDVPSPDQPLLAFVQHTCAGRDKLSETMGDRWAEVRYGWRRGTNPVDFINHPLGDPKGFLKND